MELLMARGICTGGNLKEIDRVYVKLFRIRRTVKILET